DWLGWSIWCEWSHSCPPLGALAALVDFGTQVTVLPIQQSVRRGIPVGTGIIVKLSGTRKPPMRGLSVAQRPGGRGRGPRLHRGGACVTGPMGGAQGGACQL